MRIPVLAAVLAMLALASPAHAARMITTEAQSVSTNWAGYATHGSAFRYVGGAWTQPPVSCTPGKESFSSFWVGIGGMSDLSSGLEQVGTEADCDQQGVAAYSAWYELVPNGPVSVKMTVAVGDLMSASVGVIGHRVQVSIRDVTTGANFTRRLRMSNPDTASAEWIAEAPSLCAGNGDCAILPLADFGTVNFTGALAVDAAGHRGSITDRSWLHDTIQLRADRGSQHHRHFPWLRAQPSLLDPLGAAFSVTRLTAHG
jgi:hypothetical protein